jgi:hypothetical protein
MSGLTDKVISFPVDFPQMTTGALLNDNTLITGHQNGFVVMWDLATRRYSIIFQDNSSVTTIACLDKRIAVGYYSGGLYLLETTDSGIITKKLREPRYSVNSRIWR